MMRFALLVLVANLAILSAGCRAQPRVSPGDAGAAAKPSADVVGYPMPRDLPGMDLLIGAAELLVPDETGVRDEIAPVTVTAAGDTVTVTVAAMRVNCCTQEIKPSLILRDDLVEVRLWEYLPDICECFTRHAVRLRLAPLDLAGRRVVVYSNNGSVPVADSGLSR